MSGNYKRNYGEPTPQSSQVQLDELEQMFTRVINGFITSQDAKIYELERAMNTRFDQLESMLRVTETFIDQSLHNLSDHLETQLPTFQTFEDFTEDANQQLAALKEANDNFQSTASRRIQSIYNAVVVDDSDNNSDDDPENDYNDDDDNPPNEDGDNDNGNPDDNDNGNNQDHRQDDCNEIDDDSEDDENYTNNWDGNDENNHGYGTQHQFSYHVNTNSDSKTQSPDGKTPVLASKINNPQAEDNDYGEALANLFKPTRRRHRPRRRSHHSNNSPVSYSITVTPAPATQHLVEQCITPRTKPAGLDLSHV